MKFEELRQYVQPALGLNRADWKRHPNGGGWVQRSAFVAATAYVGPDALVYTRAKVLDHTKVEGKSRIGGVCVVADDARIIDSEVAGQAIVRGNSTVRGSSCIAGCAVLEDGAYDGVKLSPMSREDQERSFRASKVYRSQPSTSKQSR